MFAVLFALLLVGAVIDAAPQWQVLTGEYKSYQKIGDQVMAEYEKLHPDGSITRKEAVGDINKGLTYNSYQIDPEGNTRLLDTSKGFAPAAADLLGPAGFAGFPLESSKAGVAPWTPERPRPVLADIKKPKNPIKKLFKDFFDW